MRERELVTNAASWKAAEGDHMKRLVGLTAAVLILSGACADAQTRARFDRTPHWTYGGTYITSDGWRDRAGSWDPSCFDLPYLSDEFDCDAQQ